MKSFVFLRNVLFVMQLLMAQNVLAQNTGDFLVDKIFISNTGYMCELTAVPDPCAGLQSYLILEFSRNEVVVIEKDVSSCGTENITHQTKNKWSIENDVDIVIHNKPNEIEYTFIKDLALKIENGKIVGYKNNYSETQRKFDFEESFKMK